MLGNPDEITYVKDSRSYRNVILTVPRRYNEFGRCSWCGKYLKNKRWKWCRDRNGKGFGKCVSEYLATKGYYRAEVRRRNKKKYNNKMTCESCQTPIKKLKGIPKGDTRYIYDHIKPIALGGDPANPDNIQILCVFCNRIKTKKDIEEITRQRRIIKTEEIRVRNEERLDKTFGSKSRWSSLSDFQGVRHAT